jgi:hypothetical protein
MPAKGYWEKIEAGHYRSRDARAELYKKISTPSRGPKEICWAIVIDGKTQVMHEDTLRDAKNEAVRLIETQSSFSGNR